MNYLKSKNNLLAAICAACVLFTACNPGNTSGTVSDSASTQMFTPGTDTDTTSATGTMADTSAMTTTAPDTATSANNSTATTSSPNKKKGKATVVLMPETKNKKVTMDKSGVYEYSEVMPAFPGGESAIEDYVTNHIEYPETALNDSKEGRVSVAFTVDETGKVTDAHAVSNKIGDGLDEEAVRVVSSMPKWTPGTVKGKTVKARMTLPINFQIQ